MLCNNNVTINIIGEYNQLKCFYDTLRNMAIYRKIKFKLNEKEFTEDGRKKAKFHITMEYIDSSPVTSSLSLYKPSIFKYLKYRLFKKLDYNIDFMNLAYLMKIDSMEVKIKIINYCSYGYANNESYFVISFDKDSDSTLTRVPHSVYIQW